jgi:putative heme-binding domain-containing protein
MDSGMDFMVLREWDNTIHPPLGYVEALRINRADAARKYIAGWKHDPSFVWTPGHVALLDSLPDKEVNPILPRLWEQGGLEDALIPLFAWNPTVSDHAKFLLGLRSLDPEVVRISAITLRYLTATEDNSVSITAIKALRRLPDDKSSASAREAVTAMLRSRTGQAFGPDAKAWSEWFVKTHPKDAALLNATEGFDPTAWSKRAAAIKWEAGDAANGRKVFVKATCASCHDGGGAVGPSLQGISKRFGRDDLLTAILEPSRDVSPRYRPTRITTTQGKAHIGMIVYEATDGVILQTGPDTVVRIAGSDIESKRTLDTSLMPVGLLDKLTDQEIADLLAYLKTII